MTAPAITVGPDTLGGQAAELMLSHRFRHLPVQVGGRLVGMLSNRDVTLHESHRVAELMRTDVVRVAPDTPVEVAAVLLLDHKIGALPVVEGDRLVGIVTESDLFRLLARVLGADTPSTRLEVRLGDVPRQLALLAGVARDHDVPIASLVTEPGPGYGPRRIVVRIGTTRAEPFVSALRAAGLEVDAPSRARLRA